MTDTNTRFAELGGADLGLYVQVEARQRRCIADGELTAGKGIPSSAPTKEHEPTRQTLVIALCALQEALRDLQKELRPVQEEGQAVLVPGRGHLAAGDRKTCMAGPAFEAGVLPERRVP